MVGGGLCQGEDSVRGRVVSGGGWIQEKEGDRV